MPNLTHHIDSIKTHFDSLSNDSNNIHQEILARLNTIPTKLDTLQNKLTVVQTQIQDPFSSFLIKLLFVLLGAAIGFLLARLWDRRNKIKLEKQYDTNYASYEGFYLSFLKFGPEGKVYRCFDLTRKKNVFKIMNGMSVSGYEDYDGEIRMTENHGSGYYRHKIDSKGILRFGFIEIQLADGEILSHEIFSSPKGTQVSDAYRWVKQDNSKKEQLIKQCKEEQLINRNKFENKVAKAVQDLPSGV